MSFHKPIKHDNYMRGPLTASVRYLMGKERPRNYFGGPRLSDEGLQFDDDRLCDVSVSTEG